MLDIIKCSIKNISRKKTRSILTIIGIAIGVSSVILINNVSKCGSDAINNELDSLGLSGLTISASTNDNSMIGLSKDDLELINSMDIIDKATAFTVRNSEVYTNGSKQNSLVWGIDSKAMQVISLETIYGRYINNMDIISSSNVCMVDQNFAKSSYSRDNIVGKKISLMCNGNIDQYEVVGVIKTGSGILQSMIGDYVPNFIYVPYSTLQNSIGTNLFDQIAVKVKDPTNVNYVGEKIVQSLSSLNSVKDIYHANNLSKQKEGLTSLLNIVTIILSIVGAISLLVASLSIMTVMLVSVNERTREIGIKKSIGAKRKTIMLEFLMEALLLSLIGCVLGIVVGSLFFFLGSLYFSTTIKFRWSVIVLSIVFSLITGTIFGIYPAAKASKLNPVDALRSE